jgi:GH43 family beta-xylosidase
MSNTRSIVPSFVGAIILVGVAMAQTANPILPHADPFITFDPVTRDGQYVLTATGRDIPLWSGPTPATAAKNHRVVFVAKDGMTQIWSPTVWKIDGDWWVYFTAQMPSEKHKIYVLRSDTR